MKTSNTKRLGLSSAFAAEPETSALLAQLQEHLQEPGTFAGCVVSLQSLDDGKLPPCRLFPPQKKNTKNPRLFGNRFDAMMSHDTCETGLEKLTLRWMKSLKILPKIGSSCYLGAISTSVTLGYFGYILGSWYTYKTYLLSTPGTSLGKASMTGGSTVVCGTGLESSWLFML